MNTYGEKLQGVATKVLSDGERESQKRESDLSIARSNLYYSVGEQLLAKEKRKRVNARYDKTDSINHQGVLCSSRADNMLDSATMADDRVAALVTNTATAAQNVQAAANAVVKLAADIGSANNIVSASEYDTDIQHMTSEVNKAINDVAYNAKEASESTMLSSAESSQIIAKQVLTEATRSKSLFTEMLAKTKAELDKLTQTRITDTETLIAANTKRRKMRGRLQIAQGEFAATQRACFLSNQKLNLGLTVEDVSINSVKVTFRDMTASFEFKKDCKEVAGMYPSFQMNNKYFAAVCKTDVKDMVSLDFAQSIFSSYYSEDRNPEKRFIEVTPTDPNIIIMGSQGQKKEAGEQTQEINVLIKDMDGDDIEAGESYVVFLFIQIDDEYKKKLNNFSDALSSPSRSFKMTAKLKGPKQDSAEIDSDVSSIDISFRVDDQNVPDDLAEYRVILVSTDALSRFSNAKNKKEIQAKISRISIWFDEQIALQIARVNYGVAKQVGDNEYRLTAQMLDDTLGIDSNESAPLITDNFGQLLKKGVEYICWVLAVVPEVKPEASKYSPTLSRVGIAKTLGPKEPDGSQPSDSKMTEHGSNEIKALKEKHEALAVTKLNLERELEKQMTQTVELTSHKQRLEDELQAIKNEQASSGKQSKKKR